jgi:fructokinase
MAGGAPANVAVAYAKLGSFSYFAGGISTDNFGVMLKQQLENEGVKTDYVNEIEQSNTALVLVSLDAEGERSFNFYRQETADTRYEKAQIDNINWQDIGIFHFCSNTLTNTAMNSSTLYALKKAKLNNTILSFDVNLRQQLWSDLSLLPKRVLTAIKLSDVVKFSKEEAEYLALQEQTDYQKYITHLISLGVKLIIVTDGSDKVQAISEKFSKFISVPIIKAIDTTAAGDSFIAGFLYSLAEQVKQDHSSSLIKSFTNVDKVTSAVLFAAKCGAYTCQKKGAFAALPSIDDI